MTFNSNDEVVWQSNYCLTNRSNSFDIWDTTITKFGDGTIFIDTTKPDGEIHKEFHCINEAYDWVIDFSEGRLFVINSNFDFRDLIE